jgi:hypothetical protein
MPSPNAGWYLEWLDGEVSPEGPFATLEEAAGLDRLARHNGCGGVVLMGGRENGFRYYCRHCGSTERPHPPWTITACRAVQKEDSGAPA